MEKRVCLGKIAQAHGIKGFVKVLSYGEDPQLLNGALYSSENASDTLTMSLKNSLGKYWLAEIKDVSDRDAAEKLRGTELWVERDNLPKPKNGEFYIDDLIGRRVINTDDVEIGKIIAVDNFGAGDLLEIQPLSDEAFYLPFTKENVPDIKEDRITVVIPEGFS